MNYCAILYHKQSTSARTRFLLFNNDSVCAFNKLPEKAHIHAGKLPDPPVHLALVVKELVSRFGLECDALHAEEEFRYLVTTADSEIQATLVGIATIDPPFILAEQMGARFVDLTQTRHLSPAELELLRGAYGLVLGG